MSRLRDAQDTYKLACRKAAAANTTAAPVAGSSNDPSASSATDRSGVNADAGSGVIRKMSAQAAKKDRIRRRAAVAAAAATTTAPANTASSLTALVGELGIEQYADDEADYELTEAADAYVSDVMITGRKTRSRSSDAATTAAAELDTPPPRPVSPRRISDPICAHSGSTPLDPPTITTTTSIKLTVPPNLSSQPASIRSTAAPVDIIES